MDPLWPTGSERRFAVKGQPSKLMDLPKEPRDAVDSQLIEQGFSHYKQLAAWIRQNGHNISLSSLKRYGLRLQRDLETTQLAVLQARVVAEALPGGAAVLPEALVQLAAQKLCSALAEINLVRKPDLTRLFQAVSHVTQAAISVQRLDRELRQHENIPQPRRGLSVEAHNALRNALLGIEPFDPDKIRAPIAERERQGAQLADEGSYGESTNPEDSQLPHKPGDHDDFE
jgi:hypothetical protein